jgi:methyltransferase (TIGR00027 family)
MAGPDLTAVGAAFGRAAHVLLDDPPHVLDDTLSIRLADDETLRAAQLLAPDGRLVATRDEPRARWRATFVARARLVEDLVEERLAAGVTQIVILGAGLDTFAERRTDLTPRLRIFEVDEPGTQRWKQERLRALGVAIPDCLRFVPLDFESGDSWVQAIAAAGFDVARPAVIVSTGVTQYITVDAFTTTLRQTAALAPGSMVVATFILPRELVDPGDHELRRVTEERAAARGFPWISFYTPGDILSLAVAAGFDDVRDVSQSDLNARYFAGRRDGLRSPSGEHVVVATLGGEP